MSWKIPVFGSALLGTLLIVAKPATAQVVPPNGVIEWTRGGGTNDWATAANWDGGAVPASGADVLFGKEPSGTGPLLVEQDTADLAVRSLWFKAGRDYTLGGSGSLELGGGLADGGRLITVYNPSGALDWQSEINIDLDLKLGLANGYTGEIANFSKSGLRLGGALTFGQNHLRIRGGSTVHLAGVLSGAGNLTVATDAGHVVISADNSATWTGNIDVKHGFLVVTQDGALGSASSGAVVINGASSGATLAFRPNPLGQGVNYTSAKEILVSGKGYARPWGRVDNTNQSSALNLRPVGAIYNDGGDNAFAGAITLVGDTWIGARAGSLKLSGKISDGGDGYALTKVGRGLIELSNAANSWSGKTTLSEGVLRISGATDLPTTSALVLAGGTLELGEGDLVRVLGTAAGQVTWSGDGGFSAHGGLRKVTLNGSDGNPLSLSWGGGGFVPTGSALLLGSTYANHTIQLTNAINLGNALREVRVTRGTTATSRGELSGKLSGTGGLRKTGNGTLYLSNEANNYSGATVIEEGTLGGRVPSSSNIQFSGGVLGLIADFKRSLGTGNSQFLWSDKRDGGFAAYGGNYTVQLGNNANTILTFGGANSIKEKSYLVFGAPVSDGTVTFDNRIKLIKNKGNNIRVIAGTDVSRSVVVFKQRFIGGDDYSGKDPIRDVKIWGSVRDLHFWGNGRVDIIAKNDNDGVNSANRLYIDFVGARGTDLRLSGDGAFLNMRGNYPVEAWWGGSITFDNRGTWNSETGGKYVAQRVDEDTSVALYAGGFRYWGQASGNSESEATDLRLSLGANFFDMRNFDSNRHSRFSFRGRMGHYNGDSDEDGEWRPGDYQATINFVSDNGSNYVSSGKNGVQLRFKTKPADVGGIIPYATVKGAHWARTQSANTWHYLTAYDSYTTGGAGTWTNNNNVFVNASPSADVTLGQNRTINSLRLESGRKVDLNGKELRLRSGGLLAVGDKTTSITNGTLTQGANNNRRTLYAHVYNSADVGLEISAKLNLSAPSSDRPAFVKTGTGTLRLSGSESNDISGPSYIHDGTLALGKTGGAVAIGGTIIVGDHAGRDTLRLDRSEQIADDATVRLRGGHPDPAHHLMAEGVLQFNGEGGLGLHETFRALEVDGRGVIDFAGGTSGHANFLILTDLRLNLPNDRNSYYYDSRLFIRNWFEGEDYLLVKRGNPDDTNRLDSSLSYIEFEGYGPTIRREWNKDYWLITPAPEPTTYGAILGACGLGIFFWRKRQQPRSTRSK